MRLGILAMVCALLLTGCSPKGETKGQVIVGRDTAGVLVAYIGFCYEDTQTISIRENGQSVTYLENDDPDGVARVELRNDRTPAGWRVDRWSLPQIFTIRASAAYESLTTSIHQEVPERAVDMATTTPLPANAGDLAAEDC